VTDQTRITPNPDGDGVILHLPQFMSLDTQVWSVDIGLTHGALAAFRNVINEQPDGQEPPRAAVCPCMCGYPDDEDVHHPTDGSDCRSTSTEPIRDWVADLVRNLKKP
jgi:hypothetical protein